MKRLPVTTPRRVVRALRRLGFWIDRQRGSHIVLVDNGHTVVVPYHNRDLPRGTLKSIIKPT